MKLVTLPCPQGDALALNTDAIIALVPKTLRTEVHMTSGSVFDIDLPLDRLVEELSLKGWRKG